MNKRIAQRCTSRRQLVRSAHLREPMLLNNKMQHREGAADCSAGVTAASLACADVPLRVGRPVCIASFAGGGRWRGVRGGACTAVVRSTLKNSRRLSSSRDDGCGNTRAARSDPRAARNLPVETSPRVPARARGAFFGGVVAASLTGSSGPLSATVRLPHQQIKRDHCRFGVHLAAADFSDPVCVGAQSLNNICERMPLLGQDVDRNGLVLVETLALVCDIVQLHSRDGVFRNCHGNFPPFGDVISKACKHLLIVVSAFLREAVALTGSGLCTSRSGDSIYHTHTLIRQDPKPRVARSDVASDTICGGSPFGFIYIMCLRLLIFFKNQSADKLHRFVNVRILQQVLSFEGVTFLLCLVSCLRGCVWRGDDSRVAGGDSASFEVVV